MADEAALDEVEAAGAGAAPDAEAPAPSAPRRPAMRRPAAAQSHALKATKYMYHKDQKWGCKVNGKEQLTVGFGSKLQFGSPLA